MKQKIQQWLNRADLKDKALSKQERQIKWMIILMLFFVLYVITFLMPGSSSWVHQEIQHPMHHEISVKDSIPLDSSPFAMPIDSFQQFLNQKIQETSQE